MSWLRPRGALRAVLAQVEHAQAGHLDVARPHVGTAGAEILRLEHIPVLLAHPRERRLVPDHRVDPVVAAEVADGDLATRDARLAVAADGLGAPGVARPAARPEAARAPDRGGAAGIVFRGFRT